MTGFRGKLTGIRIDKDEPQNIPYKRFLPDLANQIAERVNLSMSFDESNFELYESYLGKGYGVPGTLEREAIALLARAEGVLLDPVYTGRAMGGLLDLIRRGVIGQGERVLFWHTGGIPALFAYPSAAFL